MNYALNPIYARAPLSGRGAELYGGRFNARGTPAFYTSLTIMTALKEANQVGSLQPTTLASYEADIENVFYCRDQTALRSHGMDAEALTDPTWRDQMKLSCELRTQSFARQLAASGYSGLIVKSVAPASTNEDLNFVLWKWGSLAPCRLVLVDDDNRLSK
jgi:RES domain-containing protein